MNNIMNMENSTKDETTQDDYEMMRIEISTREILELRRQGMNISEIAEAIGCSKCTVWNRLKLVNLKEDIQ